MFRINAERNITRMANKHSVRNGALMFNVRRTMGADLTIPADAKYAIPIACL